MPELVLMRHGKAESYQHGVRDRERALAPRGHANARSQALQLPPGTNELLLVSGARRTRETAQNLMEVWQEVGYTPLPTVSVKEAGYLASADTWIDLVSLVDDQYARVWVIGHNPGISELVTVLTGDYIGMATADIVRINLSIEQWSQISTGSGTTIGHLPGRGA